MLKMQKIMNFSFLITDKYVYLPNISKQVSERAFPKIFEASHTYKPMLYSMMFLISSTAGLIDLYFFWSSISIGLPLKNHATVGKGYPKTKIMRRCHSNKRLYFTRQKVKILKKTQHKVQKQFQLKKVGPEVCKLCPVEV